MASIRQFSFGLLLVAILFSGLVSSLAAQQQQQQQKRQSNAPRVHYAQQKGAPQVHTPALGPWAAASTPKMGEVPVGTPFPIKITYPLHPIPLTSTNSTTSTTTDADVAVLALPPGGTSAKMSTMTFISERTIFSTAAATFTLILDKTTTVTNRKGEAKATIAPFKTTITEPYTVTSYQQETVTSVKKHTTTAVVDHTVTQVFGHTTTAPIGSTHSTISSAGEYTRTLTLASTIGVSPIPLLSPSGAASSTASNRDNHVSAGLIVGICLGVSCFFLVIIAFFWFSVRRRRNQSVKDRKLDDTTWTGAAMTLVSSRDSKLGEKADATSTDARPLHESAPTSNPGGLRTVHDDLHSACTPGRHSMSAQPGCRNWLPTPLECEDEDEENPFLSDEERAARSPVKSAAAPRPTSLPPAQPDDKEDEARKAMARQVSVELRRTATFANMMERQDREMEKARQWLDGIEREREERLQRERPMSPCSSLDE